VSGDIEWHYLVGFGFLALLAVAHFLPRVLEMIELRKERKLWGYDPKPFAEIDKREKEE
jgi:hypothetical protein